MTRPAWLTARPRRRTIRLRLTVTYSVLFLLASAMLLAFTYVFVVRGLNSGPSLPGAAQPLSAADAAFQDQCKKVLTAYKEGRIAKGTEAGLISKCEQAFNRGVLAGAASQRDQAVHTLLLYSLVGLGIMGIVSGAAGWLLAGRALRPVHAITGAARCCRGAGRHPARSQWQDRRTGRSPLVGRGTRRSPRRRPPRRTRPDLRACRRLSRRLTPPGLPRPPGARPRSSSRPGHPGACRAGTWRTPRPAA